MMKKFCNGSWTFRGYYDGGRTLKRGVQWGVMAIGLNFGEFIDM
jgi:hypothetical protein